MRVPPMIPTQIMRIPIIPTMALLAISSLMLSSLMIVAPCRARADTIVTLEGVTFADGGTASGYFVLNVDGYMETADITTSAGTSMASVSLPGYNYTEAGSSVPSVPGPFDTMFAFGSTVDNMSLFLTADFAVTNGGSDPLILGSGSDASLAGSFEYCTQNATNCAGPGFLDGRLVTAGTLYAPEPAAISLLGAGIVLLPLMRRRRALATRRIA
jgi:hypothetical protein